MEAKKKKMWGFLHTDHTEIIEHNVKAYHSPIPPPPQLIAKSHFKPDECKVICTQLIAMGTELQPSPPTIRALTIVSFKGLAIEFTESIYMMCCVNVTDTTAEERRWLWKRVGESSSRLLQLGVKVGNNGGGLGCGACRHNRSCQVFHAALSHVPKRCSVVLIQDFWVGGELKCTQKQRRRGSLPDSPLSRGFK